MNTEFHMGLVYQEDVPAEIINEFASSITEKDFKLDVQSREIGVYAAMEWAIPTLIAAYLTKPYFESFLQEAGRDHYQLLKTGILKLFSRLFKQSGADGRDRSPQFSLVVQLNDGSSLKFIFSERLSPAGYEIAISKVYLLVSEHYQDAPRDRITAMVAQLSHPSRSLYIEFQEDSADWIMIDPVLEARKESAGQ